MPRGTGTALGMVLVVRPGGSGDQQRGPAVVPFTTGAGRSPGSSATVARTAGWGRGAPAAPASP
ncbi:hypothetical protein EF879_06765 [Micromonospora sp. HM5-17]|nr:hypothetical protein EF879_06765 [Micromonospora sp. HM5-17]